ncbi:hypothetical protein GCHA_1899 [Paraglaciecola chathamensis S18K6]|uniref:Uncharacterized protein n=1 Tax=Paraglaciecola chathamensis S18K6 TaxID=1127672 RepID=A0AAV3UZ69_9ALTE|nr:hypothetical protein GCHA_1899 [Paraglaciecola chathamensis S18K6]
MIVKADLEIPPFAPISQASDSMTILINSRAIRICVSGMGYFYSTRY